MQDYHYNDLGKELSIRVNAKKDADASPYLTCDNEYFQIILKAKEKYNLRFNLLFDIFQC